jgi:hypothetical protein
MTTELDAAAAQRTRPRQCDAVRTSAAAAVAAGVPHAGGLRMRTAATAAGLDVVRHAGGPRALLIQACPPESNDAR